MNEAFFISMHKETWKELEDTLKRLPSKARSWKDQERLHRLLFLYQSVCGHLSIARTRYGNTATVEYLNNLVTKAHQAVYVTKPDSMSRIFRFFMHEFPSLIRKEAFLFFLSTGIFIFSFLFSFFITLYQEDYALSFVPSSFVNALKNDSKESVSINNSVASVFIFTNNIRVGIMAFGLGITFGAGTVYVLANNGMLLGAIAAVAANMGSSYTFWSLILPHGIPELFCIFVCGAAGLKIAKSMLFPGILSRRRSFAAGGKKALSLLLGTIPLFVLAGLTEGYFTPLPIDPIWKYAVSAVWFAVLLAYILIRRDKKTAK